MLLGETLSLWRRFFLQMGTWFCLGFAVHHLGVQLSAVLSFRQGLLSTLVFVAGLLGFLIALILMIHVLGQGLRTPRRVQPDADAAGTLTIPHRVFETERRLDVVTSALGPFLAVYAVWGFVDEEVEELFFANLSQVGIGNPLEWSISFAPERFGFYLMLAVVSWTLGKILTALLARRRTPWLAVPNVFTDGVLVFAIFVVLVIAAKTVREWIATRVVTVEVLGGIGRLVDALPAWQLPFDLTLPEAVRELWTWLWGTLAPAVGEGLLLPLMWLALTEIGRAHV